MIGYYAHHHGSGHLHRAAAVGRRLGERMTVLSSGEPGDLGSPWVRLPRDDEPAPRGDVTADGALHWVPLRHQGLQDRSLAVATWVARERAQLLVSDVSVEMLLLARLLSVPSVAVAQRGRRDDAPHALGYDVASSIVAPWPEHSQGDWPSRWSAKTTWVGAVSRFDGRARVEAPCDRPGRCVLLLLGAGGHRMTGRDLVEAAAVPRTHWHVLGQVEGVPGSSVHTLGWVSDPWPHLCRADVVVATGGNNAIADTAAAGRPLVAVPQSRPFDEQDEHCAVLRRLGLAEVAEPWPDRRTWPRLLVAAQERGGQRWTSYHDGQGADRMARTLSRLAAQDLPLQAVRG